jgi:hypothetical protein
MATLYFRGMAEDNGKPKVGRSARLLGVRPGIDIDTKKIPQAWLDEQGYLQPEVERNPVLDEPFVEVAIRNTKGMSVSLSIESLPSFRKPPKFGGKGKDPLWQIDSRQITGELEAVQDSPTHVSILPKVTMLLEKYETALANTQNDWQKV